MSASGSNFEPSEVAKSVVILLAQQSGFLIKQSGYQGFFWFVDKNIFTRLVTDLIPAIFKNNSDNLKQNDPNAARLIAIKLYTANTEGVSDNDILDKLYSQLNLQKSAGGDKDSVAVRYSLNTIASHFWTNKKRIQESS